MWGFVGKLVITLLPKLIHIKESQNQTPGQGGTKKAEVKEIVLAAVESVEGAAGRDVFNDPEVAKAYDAMNDAIVAFQNILAKKSADAHPPA